MTPSLSRNATPARAVRVLVATLVFAWSGGARGDDDGAGTSELRLLEDARKAGGVGPLDWVFDRLPSSADTWHTETAHEEIGQRLRTVQKALVAGTFSAGSFADLCASDFRGRSPVCGPPEVLHERPGLRVVRHTAQEPSGESLEAPQFARQLRELFDEAERLEKCKFKVFRIEEPRRGEITMRILIETDGPSHTGGFVQFRLVWDTDWREDEGAWSLVRLQPVSMERARLAKRSFVDVTAAALRSNRTYREQLLVGLGEWRQRIDSASGIDIYGHQGVAVGDVDGDGWEDFYVPQPSGLPDRLFRNRGDGTFEDITESAGVGVLDTTGGALFVDLDNDGDEDLVVVSFFEVLVFENLGKGKFRRREDTALATSGAQGASSLGCAAADHDGDGDLDLYVFCYIFWAGAGSKTHTSYPYPYHDANNGTPNYLFRNEGEFRFSDVTREAGLDVNNRRFSLAASWSDFDDDGDPDLYVANDFGRNNLYQNRGDGTFEDIAGVAGAEDTANGMSVDWEDYDADGRLDLYVGNMWSSAGRRVAAQPEFRVPGAPGLDALYRRMARGNTLLRNQADGRFEDVTVAAGVEFGRWAWSSLFIDHDADGREDLYVVNGFISNERHDDL